MAKDEKTNMKNKKTKVKVKKEKKESYLVGVRNELKKVKWPNKSEVLKYTLATIVFIIILVGFFVLLNLGMSLIKGVFN